ncbi:MAG: hypothetical protein A2741_02280 [Candidatus Zambryskibacteria bacterium RIFCSPHIGHO2_01_FULL_43_27]|uniref:Isoleucine--tRNA ligase n=1 Tax=Candidatus Zambryskibacteria bacterium RIFCSPLOWO2_01_FULL_43_17 TaxID=1802760 RepID=A0A1G2U4X3_9BACT|nr:MAG: hypothetical protein A2741_02280 [Candidatus Zambryskibacteria bacterium RIFCSPHIGHO2_01_FULL_43_27]OHB04543.1 MAG: hypothetical protein A2920_01190 [Candidatus Zambryskibacteria bacterium RIFCSPLOWO2_01_FULL_43_17]
MAKDKDKTVSTLGSQKSQVAFDEEKIISLWKEIKAFERSVSKHAPKGNYVFYDGPPFATGLPHYGHILGSAVKDTVARYQTMRGFRVERKWGWDCHGLPIENIVEKDLKVSGKKEIEALGVDVFNEYAKSKVLDYVSHWKDTVERIGRWIDFDGSYKTMDNSYIESVWWALNEINKKGLVYEGTRVLPYCPRCETPIANSEIAMDNSYKDITDISVYVKLELEDAPNTFLLAWTTTPWTLPGNTAAAVNEEIEYVELRIKDKELGEESIIIAKERVGVVKEGYEIVRGFKGKELVGKKYRPIFDYFARDEKLANRENGWKVYSAPYVTTESGTGIVHLAPAYGAEDMELAEKYDIPFVRHVGSDGKFTKEVTDFAGERAKPKEDHQSGDVLVIKDLAHRGLLFAKEKIVHSYPHCHRCETPLYYFALPAWFIDIQSVKKKMLKLGEDINWIPEHLKHGRFGKSMEAAPDWNISRNRFWASPLPIWKCEKCGKTRWVASVEDLKSQFINNGNTFIFVRHGESEHNVLNIATSDPKAPYRLTGKGKDEILKVIREIKDKDIDVIYSSPFLRTKETSTLIAEKLLISENIIEDKRLGDFDFGDFDGKPFAEFLEYEANNMDTYDTPIRGGESYLDAKKRFGDFLYEINKNHKDKTILVVTHGIGLEVAPALVEGADMRRSKEIIDTIEVSTGSIYKFDFTPIPHNKNFELDLHRPYIDEITLSCECGGVAKRIPEVLDCWFESGSMPFAQKHYPFENKEWFKENFPAQFIAEYIAQTRTWFYYLHTVSSILFGKAPFENVVTTGTVLDEDGEKMSKSKGNFPDPAILFDKYGVDALRFYMLSSPLMKSEDLNFSEKGVDEVYKKNILRMKNVISFYEIYKGDHKEAKSEHVLDRWIIARLNETIKEVTDAMEAYKLDQAHGPISRFVDDLSTWYLRRSRDRMKEDSETQSEALSTMHFVLKHFALVSAPFSPFLSEEIYQKFKEDNDPESVHLAEWPETKKTTSTEESLIVSMALLRSVASLALEARAKAGVKVRQPLRELRIKNKELDKKVELLEILRDEVNVKNIVIDEIIDTEIVLDIEINEELKMEGDLREIMRAVQEARKAKGLMPKDLARAKIYANEELQRVARGFVAEIKKSCNLSDVEITDLESPSDEFLVVLE